MKSNCAYCGTSTRKLDSRGNCVACGAPVPDEYNYHTEYTTRIVMPWEYTLTTDMAMSCSTSAVPDELWRYIR